MAPIAQLLFAAIAIAFVAVVLYALVRRYERQLGKECAIIIAVFGGVLGGVAATKTNSPPARAIRQVVSAIGANAFTALERQTGYTFSNARVDETHDLAMPDTAQIAERIARRGAHQDGFWLFDAWTNRLARAGLELEHPVWVQTDGTVTVHSPATGIPIEELSLCTTYSNITVYAPLQGSFGFLPGSRWPDYSVSRIWTAVTDRGTRVVTWEGALRDRDPAQPVSFQAEFHGNGDITYRYDPPQTNFTGIGLYRGGMAQTFGLSDFLALPDFQDLSPTNNFSTFQPFNLSTLTLSYIGDLGDGTDDTDDDGLTDWEEIKVDHTNPHLADTDGDGLSDGDEVAAGTDPFNPDEDDDGLADGASPDDLAMILAADAASANLVVAFGSAANTNGAAAPGGRLRGFPPPPKGVLSIDGVPLIVQDGASLNLNLPVGRTVGFAFSSPEPLRLAVSVSGNGTPVLADDASGFFAGGAGLSASGRLLAGGTLSIECTDETITGPCVHEIPGTRQYRVALGDNEWEGWRRFAVVTGENADTGSLTLSVADHPPSSAWLDIAFPAPVALVGGLSASVAIHRCDAIEGVHEYCTACGFYPRHARGLAITPSRALLGAGAAESMTFSVTDDSYARTPAWSLSPQVEGGPTLIDAGGTAVVVPGTTPGTYTLAAHGEGCADTAEIVVYGVDRLTITSGAFPPGQETAVFPGMVPHPFDVTHSPVPDLHQPFFYKDAQTNFVVAPLTVDLNAHLVPEGAVADSDVPCRWSLLGDNVAGSFSDADKATAHFSPTTGGGVYRFSFSCGTVSNSEAVLVLPLSGARIDEIVMNDLARADAFAAKVVAKYSWWDRNSKRNGRRWFWDWNAGDYVGRPDNATHPTVWAYNQLNTTSAETGGLGCCATLCGLPVRLSKVSNFLVGYASRKIGMTSVVQSLAQHYGTPNDQSAGLSWDAGVSVAGGANAAPSLTNLVQAIWGLSGDKGPRIWPNPAPPDNYIPDSLEMENPDCEFASPRFLYMPNP